MLDAVGAAVADDGLRAGLLVTSFGFGLRHGVDWDHIAAITDITGSQDDTRSSMRFATLYALGHGAVVFALGSVAIVAGDLLPAGVDAAMERVVGLTLLLLGAWIVVTLVRNGRDFRMRSRWMLVLGLVHRVAARRREVVVEHEHDHDHGDHPGSGHGHDHDGDVVDGAAGAGGAVAVAMRTTHRHQHVHRGTLPRDPFASYGTATSLGVGALHGIGAETATQVLIFLAAAQAGGAVVGELVLLTFVAGLVASNTVIAAASTLGFLNATRSFRVYAGFALLTAAFSVATGALFVLGQGTVLPAIFAG